MPLTIFAINNQCIIIMKKSLFLIASICLFSFLQQEVVHASKLMASPIVINALQDFFPNDAERNDILPLVAPSPIPMDHVLFHVDIHDYSYDDIIEIIGHHTQAFYGEWIWVAESHTVKDL